MKKKRILFMAQLPPPVHGAALRNKSLLESKLLNSEFDIISLPLKFIDDMKDMGKISFYKIMLMLRHSLNMIYILAFKKIDLVYFTMSPSGGAFYRDILFISIIKLFRKKRLLHFRMKGIQATGKTKMGARLVRFAFKGSDIVCLSKHHTEDIKGFTDRPPFIVPNGIKIEKEYLHLADAYKYSPGTIPKLLFVSNVSVKKGIPEMIAAYGILKRKGYAFTASIVGDQWYMSFAEAEKMIQEEDLQDRVKLEGPKFGREKFAFLAAADIFVFPTWFELFPGVVLEAMQFGKAIVSTFEGSIPDILENHQEGILVPQKDSTALADALAYLLDNPDKRRAMAAAAKARFFRDFTLEAFEQKMHSVFEAMTNNGPHE